MPPSAGLPKGLVGAEEERKPQKKLEPMKPEEFKKLKGYQKQYYLTRVFERFDKDRSGSIDTEELYRALKYMELNIGRSVCTALLADMDEDKSGTVDLDEFVRFFDRLQSFEGMQEAADRKRKVTGFRSKVMSMYLICLLLLTFYVSYSYVLTPNP